MKKLIFILLVLMATSAFAHGPIGRLTLTGDTLISNYGTVIWVELGGDTLWLVDGGIYWGRGADSTFATQEWAEGEFITGEQNALEVQAPPNITSEEIFVGEGSGDGAWKKMSGDVTMANTGVVTIGNDKILEAHLKAVNSPTDEYALTYESTTGDFEWQSAGSSTGL